MRAPSRMGRSRRVSVLLGGVVVLSIADLVLTLTYLTGLGMFESNPVARLLMQHAGPGAVVAWKLLTVLLCSVILYWTRRHRISEVASWGCFVALVLLSIHWGSYSDGVDQYREQLAVLNADDFTDWVSMPGRHGT